MGLLSALFGGSSSKSESGNKAYDFLKSTYGGAAGYTGQAGDAVSKFLGGDTSGFDAYKRGTGFDFGLGEGLRGVTGTAAARGLLNSGSTAKALTRYGNDYSQQYADNYLGRLMGLGQLGLGAGGLIASGGQYSKGKGSSDTGGLGQGIGAMLAMIPGISDRRAKRDIVKIGEAPDGLGLYRFRYLWSDEAQEGVMADEVAKIRPWALGPKIAGFDTVRYDLLEAA